MSGYVEYSSYDVPLNHYAVTDGETWECYPKRYCKGARVVKCRVCGAPATHVDAMYPYFDEFNLCDECKQDKDLEE